MKQCFYKTHGQCVNSWLDVEPGGEYTAHALYVDRQAGYYATVQIRFTRSHVTIFGQFLYGDDRLEVEKSIGALPLSLEHGGRMVKVACGLLFSVVRMPGDLRAFELVNLIHQRAAKLITAG